MNFKQLMYLFNVNEYRFTCKWHTNEYISIIFVVVRWCCIHLLICGHAVHTWGEKKTFWRKLLRWVYFGVCVCVKSNHNDKPIGDVLAAYIETSSFTHTHENHYSAHTCVCMRCACFRFQITFTLIKYFWLTFFVCYRIWFLVLILSCQLAETLSVVVLCISMIRWCRWCGHTFFNYFNNKSSVFTYITNQWIGYVWKRNLRRILKFHAKSFMSYINLTYQLSCEHHR